jgi:hypothetical protein|tara:strand:- start:147 stop:347 length:201 start_codon:yes stop_codon:yes gene_type:complete
VQYCLENPASTVGLLGQDSDFFVLPTPVYLVLESLRLYDARPVVSAYPRPAACFKEESTGRETGRR